MSVGIYFSGLYVKIYKIKSGFGAERGHNCFPLKTPSSVFPMTPPGRGPYGPQGHSWQDL